MNTNTNNNIVESEPKEETFRVEENSTAQTDAPIKIRMEGDMSSCVTIPNISEAVCSSLTEGTNEESRLEFLLAENTDHSLAGMEVKFCKNQSQIHLMGQQDELKKAEEFILTRVEEIKKQLKTQTVTLQYPNEDVLKDLKVAIGNGGVVKKLEWETNANKTLCVYARVIIDTERFHRFGKVESLDVDTKILMSSNQNRKQILHNGKWYTECGTVTYKREISTVTALLSQALNPAGNVVLKRPITTQKRPKEFKGALVKLKWPLRSISKVCVKVEADKKSSVDRSPRLLGSGKRNQKWKLFQSLHLQYEETKGKSEVYSIQGNFGRMSDKEVDTLVRRKIERILGRKVQSMCFERNEPDSKQQQKCQARLDRKILKLHLQKWHMSRIPHLKLSQFKVEVQDVEDGNFLFIDVVYYNYDMVKELWTGLARKTVTLGAVLERVITLRNEATKQIGDNLQFFFQTAIPPSEELIGALEAARAIWMELAGPEVSMTIQNNGGTQTPVVQLTESSLNLFQRWKRVENTCIEKMFGLIKAFLTPEVIRINDGDGASVSASVVTIERIHWETNCVFQRPQGNRKSPIWLVYGSEDDKKAAKEKLREMQDREALERNGEVRPESQGGSLADDWLESEPIMSHCGICLCPLEEAPCNFTLSVCGHSFHSSCLRQQINVAIQDRAFPIQCAECEEPLFWEDIISPELREEFPTGKTIRTTLKAIMAAYVPQTKGQIQFCITPDCPGIYSTNTPHQVGAMADPSDLHTCAVCSETFCTRCRQTYYNCHYCWTPEAADEALQKWMNDDVKNRRR